MTPRRVAVPCRRHPGPDGISNIFALAADSSSLISSRMMETILRAAGSSTGMTVRRTSVSLAPRMRSTTAIEFHVDDIDGGFDYSGPPTRCGPPASVFCFFRPAGGRQLDDFTHAVLDCSLAPMP